MAIDIEEIKRRSEELNSKNIRQNDLFIEINVNEIEPNPYQPRRVFDEEKIAELAESIKKYGLKQPIVVVEKDDMSGYRLVMGERRLRAVKMLGEKTIKAIVDKISDRDMKILAIIENIQRENLTTLEQAEGVAALREADDEEMSIRQIADLIKKSKSHIGRLLSISKIDEETKKFIRNNNEALFTIENLLEIANKEREEQLKTAKEILSKKDKSEDKDKSKNKSRIKNPDWWNEIQNRYKNKNSSFLLEKIETDKKRVKITIDIKKVDNYSIKELENIIGEIKAKLVL